MTITMGEAERSAYAAMNKQDRGGKKSGSGRGESRDTGSSRKGGHKGGSSSHHGGFKKGPRKAKEAGRKGGKTAYRS